MLFNTFQFLWLFPFLFCFYYAVLAYVSRGHNNVRWDNGVLIAISYGLYLQWRPVYALILLGVTIVTYLVALFIDNTHTHNKKGQIFIASCLTLLPLLIFKYLNFVVSILNSFVTGIGMDQHLPGLNWVLPLGISFYTLQALGYLFDVYYRRIKAEHNWWDYMLFVSFFPQIAAGPISKAADLLPQIKSKRLFSEEKVVCGCRWLLWGMFLKVVMADRVGIQVDAIMSSYQHQSSLSCILGIFLYSFQIYGDFAGYSFMALGVGKIFGFELVNNFRRPYFSQSVTEFWHRWHISLSSWLRDYVYIPLGGSRCSKIRNYWNILVTFFVSGIWHGANWTFIVWGLIHGVVQVVEKAFGLHHSSNTMLSKFFKTVFVFIVINIAWIFFRMPTLQDAIGVLNRILSSTSGAIINLTPAQLLLTCLGMGIVFLNDLLDEFSSRELAIFSSCYSFIRWSIYVILAILILSCGVFDSSQFIYAKF